MKECVSGNVGDTVNSINKIIMVVLILMLVLTSSMGFLLPPMWKIGEIDCEIKDTYVKETGKVKHCFGGYCYTEYYFILEDNSTVWVSPATYLTLKEGDKFNWPVC